MNRELRASIIVDLAGNLQRNAARYGQSLQQFSQSGQRNLSMLSSTAQTTGKMLDSIGKRWTAMIAGSIGAGVNQAKQQIEQSANLDKQLVQLAQTAGVSIAATGKLRTFLFELSQTTGKTVDELLVGMNALIQSGQTWDQALATISAINNTMAVTGARADVLANSVTAASEIFKFDLTKPEKAVELLDQMTVAGRLGNAKLKDLAGIFARVGGNAKAANLSFTDTLGFIEQLSMIEKQPERLATLADSTIRLVTNQKYLQNAAKGQRREAFDVLDDIAKKYKVLKTDVDRDKWIAETFGETNPDTIRGLRTMLSGDAIQQARRKSAEIAKAGGTINKDMQDALNNSIDQVARLKAALRHAADDFAQPINDAISNAVKYLLDERRLSGKEILGAAAVGAVGLFAGIKGGGKLLQKFGNVGAGVATGKALEEMAGVTPVYVVNMPSGGVGELPGIPGLPGNKGPNVRTPGRWDLLRAAPNMRAIGAMGAGAMGIATLAVAGAGAAGWATGRFIDRFLSDDTRETIGGTIATILAQYGNKEAQQALDTNLNAKAEVGGTIKVEIDDKRVSVTKVTKTHPNVDIDVYSGQRMR